MSTHERLVPRRVGALAELFALSAQAADAAGAGPDVRLAVDFVLEELFTNIVKYGRGQAPVRVVLTALSGGLEVMIEETEALPFDPTAAPDVDITLPLAQRTPGGLGLHLIRRMVDTMDYYYEPQTRTGRVRFRKTSAPRTRGEGC